MWDDQFSLKIFQVPSKRFRSGINNRVVVEQNVQVDCSRTVSNRGYSPYGTLYSLEDLQKPDRRRGGSNLKGRD